MFTTQTQVLELRSCPSTSFTPLPSAIELLTVTVTDWPPSVV